MRTQHMSQKDQTPSQQYLRHYLQHYQLSPVTHIQKLNWTKELVFNTLGLPAQIEYDI